MNVPNTVCTEVAIVGSGMVGLTLALALAEQGLELTVITDAAPELAWDEALPPLRVSAINQASARLLGQLQAWPAGAVPYDSMRVWDSHSRAQIEFSAREVGQAELGWIVDNRLITRALWQRLQEFANVRLLAGAAVARIVPVRHTLHSRRWVDEGFRIEGPVPTITAALLVGADGAQSKVRQQLQIGLKHPFGGQSAIVGVVQSEHPHQRTAYQRFLPEGPLALLPLADPHQCSIVWSMSPEAAERRAELDVAVFNGELTEAFAQHLGQLQMLSPRVAIPLMRQQAETYIKPQAVLMGDAAHRIHPLAGQGVNLGLADVNALVDVLQHALQTGRPLNSIGTLERYQQARYGVGTETLLAMEALRALFQQSAYGVPQLRGAGVNTINRLNILKNECIRIAMGIQR